MRLSRLLFQTLREAPKEADIASHRLMIRASLIRQVAAGMYQYLPFGWRVVLKVAAVVREEMDRAGAQEVMMPHFSPRALWDESGRWAQYGKELFRIKDRHEREFALGPTHEETFTDLARAVLRSHRRLPVTLYQIQAKFRDEIRPRFGVIRTREFLMKDGYSFDADEKGAEDSYAAMREAYNRIFTRLGLKYRMVEADTGLMGGSFSQEFMVLAGAGEEVIISCSKCSYAANAVMAAPAPGETAGREGAPSLREVSTPGAKTAEAVAAVVKKDVSEIGKILFYRAGGKLVGVMLRGNHALNESKLARHLGVEDVSLADPALVERELGVPVGFIGPVGLAKARIIADRELMAAPQVVTGANKPDAHLVDVVPGRDFKPEAVAQLREIAPGDRCPKCGQELRSDRGIEVGHIFMLGDKYSKAMGAKVLDEKGKEKTMIMGCYGIGITRIVAAAIEQSHDEKGIIWPEPLAPYRCVILPLGADAAIAEAAKSLYRRLNEAGVEALLDDRPETPGVKFKDADLMGVPYQIVIGKAYKAQGQVEFRVRAGGDPVLVDPEEAARRLQA